MASTPPVIWWIKRDFRVADNNALQRAIATEHPVLPLFIFDPALLQANDSSAMHLHAQWQGLTDLLKSLQQRKSHLYIAIGDTQTIFEALHQQNGFRIITSHQETGGELSFARDRRIQTWCNKNNIDWIEETQNGVIRGPHNRDDRPRAIATRLLSLTCVPAPESIHGFISPERIVVEHPIFINDVPNFTQLQELTGITAADPMLSIGALQRIDENSALDDLNSFLTDRGLDYLDSISSPDKTFDHGSRLSTHLAWGTLSLRTVFKKSNERIHDLNHSRQPDALRWKKSLNAFQSRLHWHDHFIQRFESACDMEFQALNPAYRNLVYSNESELQQAWNHGNTGIPMVDASIRCLRTCGFLNFRMRAMLVSVACYGFGLSWRDIQYRLARIFLDYEPGIHFSQIQMQAGIVGINTLRVYNPHKQLLEHDPDCHFVKRWIPELQEFSATEIANYQTQTLGDYISPIHDIATSSTLMLKQIMEIRNSADGISATSAILAQHGSRRAGSKKKRIVRKKGKSGFNPQMSLDLFKE